MKARHPLLRPLLALPLSWALAACAPATDPDMTDAGPDVQADAGVTPNADAGTTPEADAGTPVDTDAGTLPDTDAGTGGDGAPTDEMLRTLASRISTWYGDCLATLVAGEVLTDLEPIYYEQMTESLVALTSEENAYQSLLADAANPRARFVQSGYDACLALLESPDCSADLFEALEDACGGVFVGQQADGAACADDDECAGYRGGASFCETPSDDACGVCAPRKGAGEACQWDNACQEGFECDFFTDTCTAIPGAGDACTFTCAEGYECGGDGTCVTPPVEGEDCTPGFNSCGGFFAGLACDGDTMKCVAIEAVAVGETCDNDARHCINSYTVNVCSTPNFGEPGICQARPGLGASCPDYVCADDLVCDDGGSGNCEARPAVGSACVSDKCAAGAVCDDNNQCVALPGAGEACVLGACGEGLECSDDDVCVANDSAPVDVCAMR